MDCKEDISDSDSGIMLHSGPDSPTSPVKDMTTHTRAMRLKHQALEERLELCLFELRKLCIREAELTGKMSPDYPLSPDEKPPQIRRRIGAAFKLDEGLIHQDGEESVLSSLEAELSLQRQICEAARRLSLEENISKPVRKSRQQQCKRQERKLRDLQEAVFQHRIRHGCASPQMCHAKQRDLSISDDSSLSDAAAMDDESDFCPSMVPSSTDSPPPPSPSRSSYPSTGSQSASVSVSSSTTSLDYQRCPIQNSPWRESSLDQPYQKSKVTPSASSSRSSSPCGTPVQTGVELRLAELPPPMQLASMRSLALLPTLSNSAPSTPELPVRRQLSQSFRLPRSKPDFGKFSSEQGHGRMPRRHVGEPAVTSPENSPRRLVCQSSSEDSSSEHSVPSNTSSPSRNDSAKAGRSIPPPYGYHLNSKHKGTAVVEAHSFKNNSHHSPANNAHHPTANNAHHPITNNAHHPTTNNAHHPTTNNAHHVASNQQANNSNRNNQHQPVTNSDAHVKKTNQQRPTFNRDAHVFKNNNNSNQQHPPLTRPVAKEGSSLEAEMDKLRVDPSSPARPVSQNNNKVTKDVPSPKRSLKPPPPPYTRLVRTPSLKEYPTHLSRRLLPREIVCEELKMWHQHTSIQGLQPRMLKRQGSLRIKPSPNREPPAYQKVFTQDQAPQVVILQRAPDGTPMQWFEEEDAEIVSQV